MRYFVNRTTKEHRKTPEYGMLHDYLLSNGWDIVQADSGGWIPHTGTVCPLPLDCIAEFRAIDGEIYKQSAGAMVFGAKNGHLHITHYRPILAEKVQEPDFIGADLDLPADCFEQGLDRKIEADKKRALQMRASEDAAKLDLIGRLCVAHKVAQTIPDLEAELREVLGSMGYDLVARSPFVEPEDYATAIAGREPAVETPQDMDDWRNWREGDLVECVDGHGWGVFKQGGLYRITKTHKEWVYIETWPIYQYIGNFRFHSRPAKGEK